MVSKSVLMFPIKILLLWNILTIILFIFSPYEWAISVEKFVLLLSFLFISLYFLYLGYLAGLKKSLKFHYNPPANLVSKWFNISLFIKLIWILPSYCDRLGLDLLDFNGMFLRLALGFSNFGESYASNLMIEFEDTSFSFFYLIKQILSAITSLAIPLGILLWGKLNRLKKMAIVTFVVIDVFYWMGIGTNVGVVNNFLIIFFMIVVTHPNLASFSKLRTKYKLYIFCTLFLILSLFSINISQRYDYNYKGSYNIYDNSIVRAKINKESFLLKITNPSFHGTIISTSNYLNQGYYHITMAFNENFTWTYGIGNNYATLGISQKLVGENLMRKTYIGKLEKKGVDPFGNWHSAYLWFANDFTFFGVPIVLFFIGFLFSVSWNSTLKLNDPFAPVIFTFCLIEIFYLCANNHVFSFSFYPFHILVLLWILSRYKYAKRTVPPPIGG